MIKKRNVRKKRALRKKYFYLLSIFNNNGSQTAISKGKFLGGYLLAISIFLTFILTIVWQNATVNKMNYNIARLQKKKFDLINDKKVISMQISKLMQKERIVVLGKKLGLVLPDKNYVVIYNLTCN